MIVDNMNLYRFLIIYMLKNMASSTLVYLLDGKITGIKWKLVQTSNAFEITWGKLYE